MMNFCFSQELSDRSLIDISGDDAQTFLQGIVTCDIERIEVDKAGFGALLSPQGKILFDFFIIVRNDKFVLDVASSIKDDLIKRLMFYRLRAKVDIEPGDEAIQIHAIWGDAKCSVQEDNENLVDPRHAGMGWRTYTKTPLNIEPGHYQAHRIAMGMPEGGRDFEYGASFPHEALMDQMGGIDFKKGCYVGQEVVSRMQHRGTARKRFIHVKGNDPLPLPATPVKSDGKPIGELTSVDGENGLALVRLDRAARAWDAGQKFYADDNEVILELQPWVNFSWPQENIKS